MTTDKTGAQTTVRAADGKYTIAVDGQTIGLTAVADRDNQRVFYHTEIDDRFGGRGLATILVREALEATRADGKRVVAVCEMVAAFLKKNPEFSDITDPVTPETLRWAQTLPTG
ncbi:MAG: GNAT family N-acetyltransferase [Pseudonocardiaceae bacterium]